MEKPSTWLQRKILSPLLSELRQGATPEGMAASAAVAAILAIIPIFGITTALCFLAGRLFRLNHVVMQGVNCLMYPLQLLLILPFLRIGETLASAERLALSPASLAVEFSKSPWAFFEKFGKAIALSSLGWALCAPLALWALNTLLRFIFRKTAARFQ
jgi:uncharacterized protein (DUF2062 family)